MHGSTKLTLQDNSGGLSLSEEAVGLSFNVTSYPEHPGLAYDSIVPGSLAQSLDQHGRSGNLYEWLLEGPYDQ